MLAVTVTLPGFLRFARPSLSIASTSSLLDRKSACAQHRRGCVYRCRLSSAITELRACALDGESTLHGSLAFKIKRSRVPARCGFKNSEDLEFFVRLDMRPGSDAAPSTSAMDHCQRNSEFHQLGSDLPQVHDMYDRTCNRERDVLIVQKTGTL